MLSFCLLNEMTSSIIVIFRPYFIFKNDILQFSVIVTNDNTILSLQRCATVMSNKIMFASRNRA